MKKKSTAQSAFFSQRALVTLLLCAAACFIVTGTLPAFFHPEGPAKISQRTLTFAERVAYQRAVEEVYWEHRIWPQGGGAKPSLDQVMSAAQITKKVDDYLRKSQALENYWHQPITPEQLQAEMDRIAHHTKQPQTLREIFAVLGNDPAVIAECLARPVLVERKTGELNARDGSVNELKQNGATAVRNAAVTAQFTLPAITSTPAVCLDNWTATSLPSSFGITIPQFGHAAVWTGSEMIVWGGGSGPAYPPGGKYNPTTDSWSSVSTANEPVGRFGRTAVWTGTEMIIWGGHDPITNMTVNSGGRYNPGTDTWTATSTSPVSARQSHTAVWTGTEMIVWGGASDVAHENTGGRYNPATDSWTATSLPFVDCSADGVCLLEGRELHTAVWTGTEMIVWGGSPQNGGYLNNGGRYNPSSDTWTATSISPVSARQNHTAVWTGTEMIVWGGTDGSNFFNTGGRYNPTTNAWSVTSLVSAPEARVMHTAVWTGNEMIVWGGFVDGGETNAGGRYNPVTNSWTATSTANAPSERGWHSAVWTGSEMIVWGGVDPAGHGLETGGRYCGQSGPTPTPTPTATPRVTPRPRPTAKPRPTPPPHLTPVPPPPSPRPTPWPRPSP